MAEGWGEGAAEERRAESPDVIGINSKRKRRASSDEGASTNPDESSRSRKMLKIGAHIRGMCEAIALVAKVLKLVAHLRGVFGCQRASADDGREGRKRRCPSIYKG